MKPHVEAGLENQGLIILQWMEGLMEQNCRLYLHICSQFGIHWPGILWDWIFGLWIVQHVRIRIAQGGGNITASAAHFCVAGRCKCDHIHNWTGLSDAEPLSVVVHFWQRPFSKISYLIPTLHRVIRHKIQPVFFSVTAVIFDSLLQVCVKSHSEGLRQGCIIYQCPVKEEGLQLIFDLRCLAEGFYGRRRSCGPSSVSLKRFWIYTLIVAQIYCDDGVLLEGKMNLGTNMSSMNYISSYSCMQLN